MEIIREVTRRALRAAGELIRGGLRRELSVQYKGDIDPVTEIDLACEACVIRHIREHFPDHDIMTEESSAERRASPHRWIIDPLDGTVNYSHGYPRFAVSVGYERRGELLLGGVYDPILDELYFAERGAGAFLNDQRMHVSDTAELRRALVCTGFPYDVRQTAENNLANFSAFILTAQGVRRDGSACLNFCYVAAGRFDGIWEVRLKPWDVAAGALLISEAGGMVTACDGGPFDPYSGSALATNGKLHAQMAAVLRRVRELPEEAARALRLLYHNLTPPS